MKRLSIIVWAIVLLTASLFAGCTDNGEFFRQNAILISDKWNDAKLQNGDVITLDYYCEKATYATVSIVADDDSGYSTNVLQYEKHLMKRGDGVIDITLNVGDYVGKAIVGISYLGIYSNAFLLMDDIEEDRARTFNIEIVSKEDGSEQTPTDVDGE